MNQSPSIKTIIDESPQPSNLIAPDIEPIQAKEVETIPKPERNLQTSKIVPEIHEIAIDVSQSPKILPKIEKEVKTLNQLNKIPNEMAQNLINNNLSQPIESKPHFHEFQPIESATMLSQSSQIESIKSIHDSKLNESEQTNTESMSIESAKKNSESLSFKPKKERKSKRLSEEQNNPNKNCFSNGIEKIQTAKIHQETILKIKELIALPIPDFSDIKKMEAWFEAKNRMLKLFFESGIAEL